MFKVEDPKAVKEMRQLIFNDINSKNDRDINLMNLKMQREQDVILMRRDEQKSKILQGDRETIQKLKSKMQPGEMLSNTGVITRPTKAFDPEIQKQYKQMEIQE